MRQLLRPVNRNREKTRIIPFYNIHIISTDGYIVQSTQQYTTHSKEPIAGRHIWELATTTEFADLVYRVINRVAMTGESEIVEYDFYELRFAAEVRPSKIPNVCEVHERLKKC